jgi:predicted metal-dependent phosphoesterase TrpH
MVVADLHLHTTNSDGTLTLDTLPDAAAAAGLDAVAVTDHDRLHPDLGAPVSTVDGLTVVHSIELRVETDGGARVDLLGYGARRTDELTALTESLQANRIERAREIVDCVEHREGIDLDVAFEPGVGRPHIARAIAASDSAHDYDDAFADLIGNDCECYVAREIPTAAEGLACLREACAIVGLAHPLRYRDPEGALALAPKLDALELHYPYEPAVDTAPVERAIEDYDLLVTGGSDAHGTELGLAGLDATEFERFRTHLDA